MTAPSTTRDSVAPAAEWRPSWVPVVAAHEETPGVATLALPLLGEVPRPGQFAMLSAFGIGEVAISYSGIDAGAGTVSHTVRGVGAVSRALAAMGEGDLIGTRGPFGQGWPSGTGKPDLLVLAGGLGLSPLRPAILHALHARDEFGSVVVMAGAREPGAGVHADDLAGWDAHDGVQVLTTVDRAPRGWNGRVGLVTELIGDARFDPARALALVCGPEGMMRAAARALIEAGVSPDAVHLSMERNMKCALGLCGRCQFGPDFVCRDGPVLRYDAIADRLAVREL